MPIVELKKMLGLIDNKGNEQFERLSSFKLRVLDVAKDQINRNTNLTFDYKLIKRGRSYEYIDLLIDANNNIQFDIDFQEDIEIQKFYSRLLDSGFNELQAKQISESTNEDEHEELLVSLRNKKDLRVKTNPIAYLVGVYKNKGYIK
jgi:plasmid replication initiation protein